MTTWEAEGKTPQEDLLNAAIHALADLDHDLANGDEYIGDHFKPYAENVLRFLTPLLVSNALQEAAEKFEDPEVQRRLRELAFAAETGCDHAVLTPDGAYTHTDPCGCDADSDHWAGGRSV